MLQSIVSIMIVLTILFVALGASSVASDSCSGRCFTSADQNYNCQCNTLCIQYGDCCSDYSEFCDTDATCVGRNCNNYYSSEPCQCNDLCVDYSNCCPDRQEVCFGTDPDATTSCVGRCGDALDNTQNCQCNSACLTYGDCCSDYTSECTSQTTTTTTTGGAVTSTTTTTTTTTVSSTDSCNGRCFTSADQNYNCQCNTVCVNYGDCCADYSTLCEGSGGGGDGSCSPLSVTNTEIEEISLKLWRNNTNNVPYSAITYDVQGSTSTSATNDVAPNPFFTNVDESYFEGETYRKLRALQNNYYRVQSETEDVTQEELDENDAFLDAVLATGVGQLLFEFIDSKNLADCAGYNGFRTRLYDMWFGMYDRKAPDDTSGFEHAFVGEIKGTGVSGFHNWMYFYEQEKLGYFNYQGWISQKEPRTVGMRHTWHGATKPMNGFTIGTSPEIEFALYSLCFLTRPGSKCYIMMEDEDGNATPGSIQTYTWSNSYPPNGYYIASAYFIS